MYLSWCAVTMLLDSLHELLEAVEIKTKKIKQVDFGD